MNNIPAKKELNTEQAAAVRDMIDFLSTPGFGEQFYVLQGPAGTGKTFCMEAVEAAYSKSRSRILYTAPTNKAAKVLRKITGSAVTTYAALGLRIQANGEVKELAPSAREVDLTGFDAIVVDEGSMVSSKLFAEIKRRAVEHAVKVIFMADRFQLPPVGERLSPIWSISRGSALTQVMRHDNQILNLVTSIREAMTKPILNIALTSNNADGEGVWKLNKAEFKRQVYEDAENGAFSDVGKVKVIAWRNATVDSYNQLIRRAIYGASASQFEVGERIIAAAPCIRGDVVMLATDDEATVERILETRHPLEPEFRALELQCRTESNKVIRLLVLHDDSKTDYENACQSLAHSAKANPKLWKRFWELKELYHSVKYAYAITAHRAQGSTYESVYVDYQDILLNRERMEAFQCLYVACSRPTTNLILA